MKIISLNFMVFIGFLSAYSTDTQPSVQKVFQNLVGKTFEYKLSENPGSANATGEIHGGKVMMFSEPMPNSQTVVVTGPVEYEGQSCWKIETKSEENNPNYGSNPYELKTLSKQITSYISAQGLIVSSMTITRMGGNRNQNMETNLSPYETLNHFYGQWMHALKPDYSLELGTRERGMTIRVEREEMIGKTQCYVTRVKKTMNGEVKSEELYWVDKTQKIAIRCLSENLTLNYLAD